MDTPPSSSTPPQIPGYSPFHDEPDAPVSVCLYPPYKSESDVRMFMLSSVLSTTTLNPIVATTHRQSLSEVISPLLLLYMRLLPFESMPHEMKPLRCHCSTSGDSRTYLLMDILLASSQILPGTNDDETLSKPSILGRTTSPTTPKRRPRCGSRPDPASSLVSTALQKTNWLLRTMRQLERYHTLDVLVKSVPFYRHSEPFLYPGFIPTQTS